MSSTFTLPIKNGAIEVVKFGAGAKDFAILPGLSYDGFFGQADAIEAAYADFARDYTVYLIDRNKEPREGYSVREIADDVAEVLEQLGNKRADVFGVSLGGMVAEMLAIDHPALVKRLVLGSTLSRPNQAFLGVLSRWERIAEEGRIDDLVTDFNRTIYCPATLEKYAAALETAKPIATPEKTNRFLIYAKAASSFDCFDLLDRIKCKTFVIAAAQDRVTNALSARETAEKLGCAYYEYKNFGHAVFDEAPDYKTRILEFLGAG